MMRIVWIAMLAGTVAFCPVAVQADDVLPANVTFVTSSGFWEDSGDPSAVLDPQGKASTTLAPASTAQKGYYKLIALRQPDGTAHIVLQQIALEPAGPKIVSSAELDEFSKMKAFVTDIRPETSDGVTQQPGLFATVYLRTNPAASDIETWTVLIDELGDIRIERESN
ncbi:hypothetical protein G8E10_05475 [Rhizobiaceae bacterium CRRU44]|uniref:Uncharacterized protein n=1 Tax=Ferranicluibacter rubi TaxID=2715133 RepID=A0AA43ZCC9_9HYPH|nr:hypothetical protein [Ferranicluibacter rubi]